MRRSTLVWLLAFTLLVAGCSGSPGSGKVPAFAGTGKLKVATSIYPLYEFAQAVGGDQIDLVNLVPPGIDPHDWEPTTAHIKTLNAAQLFLFNGAGFEHWVDRAVTSLDNKALQVVETSEGFDLLAAKAEPAAGVKAATGAEPGAEPGAGAEPVARAGVQAGAEPAARSEATGETGHDHDHGEFDPHLWLDPGGAMHTVTVIRDALIQQDPTNQALYEANAAAYIARLQALDQSFQTGLAQCRTRSLFTSHAAFGYLAHRYDLVQHPIMGLAPGAEPTPKALKAVIDEARAHGIKYIFFETLASDKVAKVVASEIGAQTLVLNPFEGLTPDEIAAGKDYISVMQENLANLKLALECN